MVAASDRSTSTFERNPCTLRQLGRLTAGCCMISGLPRAAIERSPVCCCAGGPAASRGRRTSRPGGALQDEVSARRNRGHQLAELFQRRRRVAAFVACTGVARPGAEALRGFGEGQAAGARWRRRINATMPRTSSEPTSMSPFRLEWTVTRKPGRSASDSTKSLTMPRTSFLVKPWVMASRMGTSASQNLPSLKILPCTLMLRSLFSRAGERPAPAVR